MTNQVHLLVTPNDTGAVSEMMQDVGRRYVGCIYRRTGTLWEGRCHAALFDSDRYLLTCYRYIELNPVRAGMVRHLVERTGGRDITATGTAPGMRASQYLALGASRLERQPTSRALLDNSVPHEDTEALRAHTQQQRALGSERFRAEVEALTRRAASGERQAKGEAAFIG